MKKGTPIARQFKEPISLKGWILDCLEDNDLLEPLENKLKELALEAASEALTIAMDQEDTMAFLSFRKKRLILSVSVPFTEGGGGAQWDIDFEKAVEEEISYAEDDDEIEQKRKVKYLRSRLIHLAALCSTVISE